MAIFNSKSPAIQTTSPLLPMITFTLSCFLLINKAKSEFSLNFPTFKPEDANALTLVGDATISNGVLQLTKKDASGNPAQNTVGMCRFGQPIRLYDQSNGEVADFTAEFSFLAKGFNIHADGLTFFISSPEFQFSPNSGGGYLGLFSPDTAFDPSKNHVVAVEFDSFTNEWDPEPNSQIPHIGININSIRSEQVVLWESFFEPEEAVATARITYESKARQLSVTLTYPSNSGAKVNADSSMARVIDFRSFLPEQVLIGFSASSGNFVETHDILSWSFVSTL